MGSISVCTYGGSPPLSPLLGFLTLGEAGRPRSSGPTFMSFLNSLRSSLLTLNIFPGLHVIRRRPKLLWNLFQGLGSTPVSIHILWIKFSAQLVSWHLYCWCVCKGQYSKGVGIYPALVPASKAALTELKAVIELFFTEEQFKPAGVIHPLLVN